MYHCNIVPINWHYNVTWQNNYTAASYKVSTFYQRAIFDGIVFITKDTYWTMNWIYNSYKREKIKQIRWCSQLCGLSVIKTCDFSPLESYVWKTTELIDIWVYYTCTSSYVITFTHRKFKKNIATIKYNV